MEISIKAAAEMAKISRTTVYEKIKSGELSRNPNGKIDSSEVLRVFGNPNDRHTRQEEIEHIELLKNTLRNTEHSNKKTQNTLNNEKEEFYKSQIRSLEESLKQAHDRELWSRQHIESLTETIKLLEAPKQEVEIKKTRHWWQWDK